MKFQYFTYFLNEIQQQVLPIFQDKRDKNDILKEVLSTTIKYKNKQSQIVFIPTTFDGSYLRAQIGKQATLIQSMPTEHSFEEKSVDHYPYCELFFHFSSDPEMGQKIAFEINTGVFREPKIQLQKFAEELNEKLFIYNYSISISPILEKNAFWSLVDKYDGKIEKVTFSYAVPNLFKLENSISEDLKDLWIKNNATNVRTELENKAGKLNLSRDDTFLSESADYIERWWWEYVLHIKWKRISNKKNFKTKNIIDFDIKLTSDNPDIAKSIFSTVFDT